MASLTIRFLSLLGIVFGLIHGKSAQIVVTHVDVTEGGTVTLDSCRGLPSEELQLFKENPTGEITTVVIRKPSQPVNVSEAWKGDVSIGVNGEVHITSLTRSRDEGIFRCSVAKITPIFNLKFVGSAPVSGANIREASNGLVAASTTQDKTLTCALTPVTPYPLPYFTWTVDGNVKANSKKDTYTFKPDKSMDQKIIKCTATNHYDNGSIYGSADGSATLNITDGTNEPKKVPVTGAYILGTNGRGVLVVTSKREKTLSCMTPEKPNPPAWFSWAIDGEILGTSGPSNTANTLTFTPDESMNNRTIKCTAINYFDNGTIMGSANGTALLNVKLSDSSSIGVVIGAVAGAQVLLLLVYVTVYWCGRQETQGNIGPVTAPKTDSPANRYEHASGSRKANNSAIYEEPPEVDYQNTNVSEMFWTEHNQLQSDENRAVQPGNHYYQNAPQPEGWIYQNPPGSSASDYQNPPASSTSDYQNPPGSSASYYQNPPGSALSDYQNSPGLADYLNTSEYTVPDYQNVPNRAFSDYQNIRR